MCGDKMRKWRISYRAIHNLYVPEYRDLLFWHEMDIREDVDNYLRDMGIKKATISRDDMEYYWGFHTIDDAICAIREHDRMNKLKSKRKNKIYYLTDNYKVKQE
jgi:hypothetical protein